MEEKKRIVFNQETEEDRVYSLSLRPAMIGEFVGQKDLIGNLKVSIEAAKQRKEPVEHILFSGPPGLGKTSLANIVAHEMNARITITSGPAIDRAGDLIGILTNLEHGDVLFIDEIHRLSKVVEEFLYPAMENFKIDFIVDKGPYAKTVNFNLKPFTLIGATTRSGLLASPLRDRFGMFYHLEFYEPEQLCQIVKKSAEKLKIDIDDDAALGIARRARGTPRVANRLLRRVRDYAQVKTDSGKIEQGIVLSSMKTLGIDDIGLDEIDRRLIRVLDEQYSGGPVGIEALAATLNEEVDTIVDVVEPYLLKIGFLRRTSRGRELTKTAVKHIKGFSLKNKEIQSELY
ncbi:MAG: Holliday junction DNA helicase RuvB [Omnitrophica WOR_2 bacterium GWF2_38_59]|nr:MAG: Holliday junction DNA helicase RuvB [Omnitrophica WOR_2 bacterium GWF2_38_59]OGX47752.1 MAG: Holliday junction DNA helicase RuvB [Omnitrophica WOR_2 bacterium RIFOXYA2_FULL_38_17]OGX52620.1 MAG: Holliday junction DNA helicase RuvB [Omnitrophica WOR_2 bacterium RIFOXYA12_FULL_38_10]OGX56003.1 MAG: Holliday junction DNA helicase RuvB [Omnitrophica WOR_2 bacterium RIFOXYB2_FULL_38_16]OGX57719.1 MAG: Holliday junction DNA helicase RuvB [Omnitrophica WOR_2 bacterium RIFOXYC2_FULL_38_12]HBG6